MGPTLKKKERKRETKKQTNKQRPVLSHLHNCIADRLVEKALIGNFNFRSRVYKILKVQFSHHSNKVTFLFLNVTASCYYHQQLL